MCDAHKSLKIGIPLCCCFATCAAFVVLLVVVVVVVVLVVLSLYTSSCVFMPFRVLLLKSLARATCVHCAHMDIIERGTHRSFRYRRARISR